MAAKGTEMTNEEIAARRQRAREAYFKAKQGTHPEERLKIAIETATRVQITPEMTLILVNGGANAHYYLRDVLQLAGFEVES
jgi:hypothetical protein